MEPGARLSFRCRDRLAHLHGLVRKVCQPIWRTTATATCRRTARPALRYDVQPNLTLMLDYQHIAYGSVPCVANPATNMLFAPFGAPNGPAFGWRDINAVKLGMEWRYTPALALRAGYAYNTPLFGSRDVQLDILAPAATQHHLTAGGEWRFDKDWALEWAGMYAPENTVSGVEIIPVRGTPWTFPRSSTRSRSALSTFYDDAR